MSNRPFTLLKTAFDRDFPLDTFVLFEQDGAQHFGFIAGPDGDRYSVTTSSGETIVLTKARLHRVPGTFPERTKTVSDRIQWLLQLLREADAISIDGETIWRAVSERRGEILSEAQIAVMCRGDVDTPYYLALRKELILARTFFTRDSKGFIPRTAEDVELQRGKESERRKKTELFERVGAFLKTRVKERKVPVPEELEEGIELLGLMAASAELADASLYDDAETLIITCERALHLEPSGTLPERAFHLLQRAALFRRDQNLSVIRHRIPLRWSPEALAESHALHHADQPSERTHAVWDDPRRRNLTALRSFTIDDESTQDMDDALALEQTHEGYTLYIHVSDVASFIPIGSALDEGARRRATSIYCPDIILNMLPDSLAHDTLSLRRDNTRAAFTIACALSHDFEIKGAEFFPSIVSIRDRLSYSGVDALLESGVEPFATLYQIASVCEERRIAQGAQRIQKREIHPVVHPGGEVTLLEIDEQGPARHLVGEMMVLANSLVAQYCFQKNIPCLYRAQERAAGVATEGEQQYEGQVRDYQERIRLKRSYTTLTPSLHATLGLSAYAQVTSPIRRYLDLVLQRQLVAFAFGEPLPYTAELLQQLNQELEEPLQRSQFVTRETRRYWLFRYLERYQESKKPLLGTVVRLDTRTPLVELDEVFMVLPARLSTRKLGARVPFVVSAVDARKDYIRLEEKRNQRIHPRRNGR